MNNNKPLSFTKSTFLNRFGIYYQNVGKISSFIIFLFSFFMLLFSCSSPTPSTDTVTFSGTITLEDTTDFSGVTVALYEPVELDTAIVRINKEYPQIGVQISQQTEFDHREHEAKYSTTTAADGSWKIENVEKGQYNVVAEKKGWGWQYQYEKEARSNFTITLYKTIFIENNLSENLIIKDNQHVVIKNSIIIPENIQLTIGNNCWIRMNENIEILNYGDIILNNNQEEFIRFFSNNPNEKWGDIVIENSGKMNLEYLISKNSKYGIKWKAQNDFQISNCIFKNNEQGIKIFSGKYSDINNILFFYNKAGISFGSQDSVKIQNAVFLQNEAPIFGNQGKLIARNNYFKLNTTGIDFSIGNTLIENNQFDRNDIALKFAAKNKYNIEYNNFNSNKTDIQTNYIYTNGVGLYNIHYNNFINTKNYFIDQHIGSAGDTLHAENNWWGTTDGPFINTKILDCRDKEKLMCINFFPQKISYIENSGIKKNWNFK